MGRAQFAHADFLRAARDLVAEQGPAAVTVSSVTERLDAPTGSFYHRFASRDVLLAELWLATVMAFQVGRVAALDAGDGLAAALHTPKWAREHLEEACLLMLYHQDDFVRGKWPARLRQGVAAQAQRMDALVKKFARDTFGRTDAEALRRAAFVLIDVPHAAVRRHLVQREAPPPFVDDLIRTAYRAIVGGRRPAN